MKKIMTDEKNEETKIFNKLKELNALRVDFQIKLKFIKEATELKNKQIFLNDKNILDYDYFLIQIIKLSVIQACYLTEEVDRKTKEDNLLLSNLFNQINIFNLNFSDNTMFHNFNYDYFKNKIKNGKLVDIMLKIKMYRNKVYAHYVLNQDFENVNINDLIFVLEFYINLLMELNFNLNTIKYISYNEANSNLFEVLTNSVSHNKNKK